MNNADARRLLSKQLAVFRSESYERLVTRIGENKTTEVTAPCGRTYQVEIQFFWDDGATGDIRVVGAIDDGGIRSFVPLTDSFIMNSHGDFVDE